VAKYIGGELSGMAKMMGGKLSGRGIVQELTVVWTHLEPGEEADLTQHTAWVHTPVHEQGPQQSCNTHTHTRYTLTTRISHNKT